MAGLHRKDVECYLRDNPQFIKSWVLDHVASDHLSDWMREKSSVSGRHGDSLHSSGYQTPGYRNPAAASAFQDMLHGRRKTTADTKRSRKALLAMNQVDLFMELIRDVANELDVDVLCHKILRNLNVLTSSDRGSLFLARGSGDSRYLVSKLFDVSEDSRLEDCLHTEDTHIRVPFGKGIAGNVALDKATINIKDAYSDPRFNKEVDKKTGYRTKHLLCMPVLNYDGDLVGVAQIINKTDGGSGFNTKDEEVFRNYLTFCGIGLMNAQMFEMSVQEYKRNQLLLKLAQEIFEEQGQGELDTLAQKIMIEARELLKCQRCCVYILEGTLNQKDNMPASDSRLSPQEVEWYKVFELGGSEETISSIPPEKLADSPSAQIAREVVSSGVTRNIVDMLADITYGHELLDYDGFKIRSLLTLPVRDTSHKVIGAVSLMNKLQGRPFSASDVNLVEAFAIFCGLGIHNCQMYENMSRLLAKQKVALEVLSYHATASQEDVDRFRDVAIPSAEHYQLTTFDFSDFILNEDETVMAVIRMFTDAGVLRQCRVPYEVMVRWTLSVKKNYRQVTYHNWRHAFNVMQTMFTMFYTGDMIKYMDVTEVFGLLVACLSHDLDHRGTNNAFQSKVDSPLAILYSTSTMEHHHFDQCIMILNSEGNNIFMSMSADSYKRVISIVEAAILSTDLALYFKKRGDFERLVKKGETMWSRDDKKELLRGMMMTACDVAAITKPWKVQKEVAQLVAKEFFEQGDKERNELHQEPIAMMDRKKKEELPKMQVGFIDAICAPVYKMLSDNFPRLKPMYSGCRSNRARWQEYRDEPRS